ncbi:MAG: hypothetical protein NT128_08285 [Proteobacteria bacterium]|nr:hypothetical protein [Pseudomonadota bacterium]
MKKDEFLIAKEHIKNNKDVRGLLIKKNIYPEKLSSAEDVKKVKRKINAEQKQLT